MKNPDAPAVKREAEEDWGKERDGDEEDAVTQYRSPAPGNRDSARRQ